MAKWCRHHPQASGPILKLHCREGRQAGRRTASVSLKARIMLYVLQPKATRTRDLSGSLPLSWERIRESFHITRQRSRLPHGHGPNAEHLVRIILALGLEIRWEMPLPARYACFFSKPYMKPALRDSQAWIRRSRLSERLIQKAPRPALPELLGSLIRTELVSKNRKGES
jgi:hypothetical protein